MFGIKRTKEINFDEAVAKSATSSDIIEKPIGTRVFYGVLTVCFLAALIVVGRIVEIGLVKTDVYKARAASNVNKAVSIPAPRGIITDRFDKPMVENEPIFSAFIKVSEMARTNETAEAIKALNTILGADMIDMIERIKESNPDSVDDVLIKQDVTREEVIALKSLGLTSVHIQSDYKRKYKDEAFSHVIGYVGLPTKADVVNNKEISLLDAVGKSGLEASYDKYLKGRNGKKIVYKDAVGETHETEDSFLPEVGKTLRTTIDSDLQRYFYERLVYNTSLRGQTSAVGIALNPQNGEVLALISLPSFDANRVGKYLSSKNQPLFNRAVSGIYNPGSTIKPLHAVAGLKEGVVSKNIEIFSRGFIEVPNQYDPANPSRFVDWKEQGWVDVYSALAKSSNIYFYAVGGGLPDSELGILSGANDIAGLGIVKLKEYWKKFGLDTKTGIDLPGESVGFLPDPEEKQERTKQVWRIGDTYNVSIGQGDISVTPLQLVDYISAVATKGTIYRPHLDASREPEVSNDLREFEGEFRIVEKGMEDSVYKPYGTSNAMADLPMKIAAKTGTAQTNNNSRTNALFVGYGPTDAAAGPEIAVLVLIENAKEGSLNAIPIAKDVLEWYYNNRISKNE